MTDSQSFWLRHLLRRAGFGYGTKELLAFKKLGYEGTVEKLLYPEQSDHTALDKQIKEQHFDYTDLGDLQRWWLFRMLYSPCPLEEKMTLFWHGHFATSVQKIKNPYLMYLQNLLLRKHAFSSFHQLLYAVSTDPAMIIWLDNQQNRRGKPNENYAREIMELFTLGIGNYSEQDIKEAARAFTGWQTKDNHFVFRPFFHDPGPKTIFGKSGKFTGNDVIAMLVEHPATGPFLAKKLLRYFAQPDPSPVFIQRVSQAYYNSNFSIRAMLKTIFLDAEFLSRSAFHSIVKSPADLVVGTAKLLDIKQLDAATPNMMSRMGQGLFQPPNVKGWDGGTAWIATDKMMERFNFAAKINKERFDEIGLLMPPEELLQKQGLRSAEDIVDYFAELLIENDLPGSARRKLIAYLNGTASSSRSRIDTGGPVTETKLRGLVQLIMTLPTYQLC